MSRFLLARALGVRMYSKLTRQDPTPTRRLTRTSGLVLLRIVQKAERIWSTWVSVLGRGPQCILHWGER